MSESPKFINEADLREVMKQYGTSLLRLVYTYVKNWTTAEDIVQETFISYAEKYDQFRGKSTLKTWLYQIAINKSKDFLKSPKNKFFLQLSKISMPSKTKSPDEKILMDCEEEIIANCLFKLEIKYREIINLYYYEDLSIKEISSLISISEANVKTRLHRGRIKFRDIYVKEVQLDGSYIRGEVKNIFK